MEEGHCKKLKLKYTKLRGFEILREDYKIRDSSGGK
jgi:hypothetical protein